VGQGDAKRQLAVGVFEQLGSARTQARIGRTSLVGDPLPRPGVDDDPAAIAGATP